MQIEEVWNKIEGMEDEMVSFLSKIIEVPAISPKSGGEGEWDKVALLEELIKDFGFDRLERYDCPDPKAKNRKRPNLIAKVDGTEDENLWVVVHTDVVPPGDLKKWDSDPFRAVVRDGKVFARGAEDNGQSLVASLFAVKALRDLGLRPKMNVGIVLVADEETGSEKGIKYLIQQGLFSKEDLILVPDGGNADGTLIEVAEKSIVWVKVATKGKQCHASMPDLGRNAFKAAMHFWNRLEGVLKDKYSARDELYDRPYSTFEPTKKEANVPNVNTIPGDDVFYIDCRILDCYKVEDVLATMRQVADEVERETDTKITLEIVQGGQAPPPTPTDAPIVEKLKTAVDMVYKNGPRPGGIGGGTCAAIFRSYGYPAAVWCRIDDTAHSPNEYCIISNLVNDAKVYATLFLSG